MSHGDESSAEEVSAGAYVSLAGHEGRSMADDSGNSAGTSASSAGYDSVLMSSCR